MKAEYTSHPTGIQNGAGKNFDPLVISQRYKSVAELLPVLAARIESDWPELDAQVILGHILIKPRTWVLAHPEARLNPNHTLALQTALERLELGEPLPYIRGHWEFFGLDFVLSPEVLIPRPETELLVEKAVAWLQATPGKTRIADIGTGSGCIAIALAMHLPQARILATDISRPALKVARQNAVRHEVLDRIDLLQCDLLPFHPASLTPALQFDLICANLPYIPTKKLKLLPVYGKEPTLSLNGGETGLVLFQRLLEMTPRWLAPEGRLLLEIESTAGLKAVSLAYHAFPEAEIHLHRDLDGQDRLLEIRLSG